MDQRSGGAGTDAYSSGEGFGALRLAAVDAFGDLRIGVAEALGCRFGRIVGGGLARKSRNWNRSVRPLFSSFAALFIAR
jgi:hypothetical protein